MFRILCTKLSALFRCNIFGYPSLEVWVQALLTPKICLTMIFFWLWDSFLMGRLFPYAASDIGGQVAWLFNLEPVHEMCLVIGLVFIFIFFVVRLPFESWLWKRLVLLDQKYYCVLATRDIINFQTIICNSVHLMQVILKHNKNEYKNVYFGEGVPHMFLTSLKHYKIPVADSHFLRFNELDDISKEQYINSAEILLAIACLSSSVAKLLVIISLYSFISAVEVFSEIDPFLQLQLRSKPNTDSENPQKAPPQSSTWDWAFQFLDSKILTFKQSELCLEH